MSTHKQRYRPSCRYFNFVCKPDGKYSLDCNRGYHRCRDDFCLAMPPREPAPVPTRRRRAGQMTLSEVV